MRNTPENPTTTEDGRQIKSVVDFLTPEELDALHKDLKQMADLRAQAAGAAALYFFH